MKVFKCSEKNKHIELLNYKPKCSLFMKNVDCRCTIILDLQFSS